MTLSIVPPSALLIAALVSHPSPLAVQSDGCALLKPAELTTLLGGTVTPKAAGAACKWSTGDAKQLLTVVPRSTGPAAEMAYAGARQAAARDGNRTVTDESGIGDKAFASLESFGVVLMMKKGSRLLQIQYHTGAAGTAKDLAALRPIAIKAIAAF